MKPEAIKFGVHGRTSEAGFHRFSESQTSFDKPVDPLRRRTGESAWRQRDLERIKEELDKVLGIRECETCHKLIDAAFPPASKKGAVGIQLLVPRRS